MAGRSEEVIGDLAAQLGLQESLFLATKVWTTGKREGIESMERSFARLRTKRIDLMQVHNLIDAKTHLNTMRDWKNAGRFRYIGVTHYESGAFPAVEKILREEKLDFLQINYSLMEREAEERILPLAKERGVAVIINRPFGGGNLFERARAEKLPTWAAEFDCKSWAQFFLKWIVANSAVTCAIPATGNVSHLKDNLLGGVGQLPNEKMRQRMVELVTIVGGSRSPSAMLKQIRLRRHICIELPESSIHLTSCASPGEAAGTKLRLTLRVERQSRSRARHHL